jgi:type I restriction enzyme S subunit
MVIATTIKKGYKQTELGLIPSDWDVKELRDVVDFSNGKAHENFISDDGDYIVVNSKFISTEGRVAKYSNEFFSPATTNSILMVMSDVPNGKAIAKCFLVDKDDTYTVNQRICNLKPKIDAKFLFYKINRNPYYLSFDDGVKQTNLKKEDVLGYKLSIPKEVPEQSAIAAVLSNTDILIERLEKLIAKKKAIKQGTMQQLLTGKKRLPGFKKEWEKTILGKVANFEHGYGLSKSDLNDNGSKKCIHYGQLFTEYKELIEEIKSKTNININNFYSKENDVLMPTSDVTPRGLATASCIKESGVVLGGGILVIRLNPQYDGLYLSYFITQNKNSVLKLVKGSTVFHLYAGDMANLEIIFPEFKEQIAIANIISDMDTEIKSLEQKRDKYIMIKQGMMQQLLTGKIRVYGNN